MNLLDIRTNAKTRFRDLGNAIYTDAEWNVYIQNVYRTVNTSHHQWPWNQANEATLTLTAGVGHVDLPLDVWRIDRIEDETYNTEWERVGNRLYLEETPSVGRDLTIRYRTYPADLTDGTEPVWPEPYHTMLVDGALMYAYADDGNRSMSEWYEAKFSRRLEDMKNDMLSSLDPSYPALVDDWPV